jgi:hypothetical protein
MSGSVSMAAVNSRLNQLNQPESHGEDLRLMSFDETAVRLGMSTKNFERIVSAGRGPRVTPISSKNRGIRTDYFREWLDTLTEDAA